MSEVAAHSGAVDECPFRGCLGVADSGHVVDVVGAQHHLEQVVARNSAPDAKQTAFRFDDVIRFQHDGQVEARAMLTGVLWHQGFLDQAAQMAERA
jgi:hypothetical protein